MSNDGNFSDPSEPVITISRVAPVRFGWVTARGWNGRIEPNLGLRKSAVPSKK